MALPQPVESANSDRSPCCLPALCLPALALCCPQLARSTKASSFLKALLLCHLLQEAYLISSFFTLLWQGMLLTSSLSPLHCIYLKTCLSPSLDCKLLAAPSLIFSKSKMSSLVSFIKEKPHAFADCFWSSLAVHITISLPGGLWEGCIYFCF